MDVKAGLNPATVAFGSAKATLVTLNMVGLPITTPCDQSWAYLAVLFWIMESVRVIEKPKRRGRFSQQRDVCDLVHQERFNRWLEGDPIEAIAEKHYVDVSQCSSVGCESYGSWPPPPLPLPYPSRHWRPSHGLLTQSGPPQRARGDGLVLRGCFGLFDACAG